MASGRVLLVSVSVPGEFESIFFLFFETLRFNAASSTGLLLRTTGLKVTAIKIDPYMNIDAGTMRPTEHGSLS